ncbi:insulinase family protein [Rhodobacterales bacterium LSUCC0031]|nr:insulinase family protein [Rhodobacterales bacterium LSUCC0031]
MLHRLALVLGLTVAPYMAQAAGDVVAFFLDNGMQVVVIPDDRAPAVTHMVWYRVGAGDELPGQSGIAHFVEHLMFKATDDMASGEFSTVVEANGGSDNAFTSWDYTAYFQRVAADRLGLMMQMEADRMRDIIFDPVEVATERSVILEERAQRTDSSAGALFNEQMRATLFLNHPYGRPIIGWRHEMEALSLADAQTFHDLWYHPNNAILIVAGDVTPDAVRALAEQHYGPIPASPDLPVRARPTEPPHIANRRVDFTDQRVANPYVSVQMLAPVREPGNQAEAAALVILAELLGGSGQTSLLARRLQVDEERSLYAAAFYDSTSLDPSGFSLVNVPVPGLSLDEAEADLWRIIDDFLSDGIDMDHFERIKFQIAANDIYSEDSTQGLARRWGMELTIGLGVADIESWPDVLAAVTPEDVMAAASRLFTDPVHVTGHLMRPPAANAEISQ